LNKFIYTILVFILSFLSLKGQNSVSDKYVQVSGIITDQSYRPVQGAAIISRKLHNGVLSENSGIYSITSSPGDTIFYRALGYKRYHTVIPVSYTQSTCNVDIVLETDTIPIAEINIFPWKTYSEFIKEMTTGRVVDPLIENMNDNIASIYVAIANETGTKISGEAGFRYAMEQNFSANAVKNQYPINNLFNPFAWAKFVNGIKNGLFKNQNFEKPTKAKVRKKLKSNKDK
jgi:hypothetical protein